MSFSQVRITTRWGFSLVVEAPVRPVRHYYKVVVVP
jgi:hypothetical protein